MSFARITLALTIVAVTFASAAWTNEGKLREILDKGNRMGHMLRDNSIQLSEDTRKELKDAYVAFSEEANRRIAEMGDKGKSTAEKYLSEIRDRTPEALQSKDAARREAENLLKSSKKQIQSFAKSVSNTAGHAGSSVKGAAKEGSASVKGHAKEGAANIKDAAVDGAETVKHYTHEAYEKAKHIFGA